MDKHQIDFYRQILQQTADQTKSLETLSCSQVLSEFRVFVADVLRVQPLARHYHVTDGQKPQILQWCRTACFDVAIEEEQPGREFWCYCDISSRSQQIAVVRIAFPFLRALSWLSVREIERVKKFCCSLITHDDHSAKPFYVPLTVGVGTFAIYQMMFESLGFAVGSGQVDCYVSFFLISTSDIPSETYPSKPRDYNMKDPNSFALKRSRGLLPETVRRKKVATILAPLLPDDVIQFIVLPFVCGVSCSRHK